MNSKIVFLVLATLILAVATGGLLGAISSIDAVTGPGSNNTIGLQDANQSLLDKIFDRQPEAQLKRFKSQQELEEFLKTNTQEYSRWGFGGMKVFATAGSAEALSAAPQGAADHSTTNNQVEGVDEADIVKNDGRYIYTITGNKLVIVDAYPAENARIVSETAVKGYPTQMFVNKNRLVVFSQDYADYIMREETVADEKTAMPRRPYSGAVTHIYVYDISERERPALARSITGRGDYSNSRMIENYVYAIVNQQAYYYGDGPVLLPAIAEDGIEKETTARDIYYFDYPDYGYSYVNIIAINALDDGEAYNSETFLGGSAQNIYVSEGNIYFASTVKEETAIRKIAIEDGRIEYKGEGRVPGHVLNQFSMDEHNGYFRIATTIGEVWRFEGQRMAKNNVYVLDERLKVVGAVEDLAPGEKIYSARFMGNRAYLVTFKKVDPLFIIDLSEPAAPKVLGKLKIPGYSDYLHPYDENHIIGLGKEAVEAEEGDFAWYNSANGGMYKRANPALYQGIKLALFDVSDPENPKDVSKYEIGDRGTDSYALHDHKAFLFSREKNLLVIPILLAEIDESEQAGSVPANAYGEYVWQGAYVFNVDKDSGFRLKGRVTHVEDDSLLKPKSTTVDWAQSQQRLGSGYYYDSQASVKRSLYMDDVLYTISDSMIKANELSDMEEISRVKLPYAG